MQATIIAVTSGYKGRGAARCIVADNDADFDAFDRLAKRTEREHRERHPDAPAPAPAISTQILREVSRMLETSDVFELTTLWGERVVFFDSHHTPAHYAHQIARGAE